MKKYLVFLFFLMTAFVSHFVWGMQSLSPEQKGVCQALQDCRDHYKDNDCEGFKSDPNLSEFVSTCSLEDINTSFWKGSGAQCAGSTTEQASQLLGKIAGLPAASLNQALEDFRQNRIAHTICKKKIGFDLQTAERLKQRMIEDHLSGNGPRITDTNNPRRTYFRCYQSEVKFLRNYQIPKIPRETIHQRQNRSATQACQKKLGFDLNQADRRKQQIIAKHLSGDGPRLTANNNPRRIFLRCYQSEVKTARNYQLSKYLSWKEAVKVFRALTKGARCLNAAGQSRFICPIAAGLIVGGGATFAAKAILGRLALRAKLASSQKKALEDMDKEAKGKKEKLTVNHLEDVTRGLDSPAGQNAVRGVGANQTALKAGIIDSDMGKLKAYWDKSLLAPDATTRDKFIRILQGKDTSPEGLVVKELFDEHYGGNGLLPPHYSPEKIHDLFKENPVLMGYHHELPGIQNALDSFRSGEINAAALKSRLNVNLGHNGPHEEFWKYFGEDLASGALKSAPNFYEQTLYGQGRRATSAQVLKPRYPLPKSAEGFIHMSFDRLSQGTRGGIEKIFYERGGATLAKNPNILLRKIKDPDGKPKGLDDFVNLLVENPKETLRQVEAITSGLDQSSSLPNISRSQRKALKKLSGSMEERFKVQNKFISDNIKTYPPDGPPFQKIELKYYDSANNPIHYDIDGSTPAKEALEKMNRFMLAEERRNGDPMKDLGGPRRGSSRIRAPIVGGLVGGLTPSYCLGYREDFQTPLSTPGAISQ